MVTSKNSFSTKLAVAHRHSELRSVVPPQQWQSELCRCTRLLQQSLLKEANNTIMDASRHRRHLGHTQKSLSATLNLGDFGHFCAYALVGATRQWAYKYARCTRFGQQSRLLWLGLAQFCGRKPIFRGALLSFKSLAFCGAFFIFGGRWSYFGRGHLNP